MPTAADPDLPAAPLSPSRDSRRLALAAAGVGLAFVALLGLCEVLWPMPLANEDQAVYCATARNVMNGLPAHTQTLNPRHLTLAGYPYLEGHKTLFVRWLALWFLAFGPTAGVAKACAIATSSAAASLVFLLGARDWTRDGREGQSLERGLWAVALFVACPLTLTRAGLPLVEPLQLWLGLCVFATPLSRSPWIRVLGGAVALGLLFRTRETGLLLLPWMLITLWRRDEQRGLREPLLLLLLSACSIAVLNRLCIPPGGMAIGRLHAIPGPALPLAERYAFQYLDTGPVPPVTAQIWATRIWEAAKTIVPSADEHAVEHVTSYLFLGCGIVYGRRARWLAVFLAGGWAAMTATFIVLYTVSPEGIRHLGFLLPLAAFLIAQRTVERGRPGRVLAAGLVVVGLGLGISHRRAASTQAQQADVILNELEQNLRDHNAPYPVTCVRGGNRFAFTDYPHVICDVPHSLKAMRDVEQRLLVGRLVLVEELDPLAHALRVSNGDDGRWEVAAETRVFGSHHLTVWVPAR